MSSWSLVAIKILQRNEAILISKPQMIRKLKIITPPWYFHRAEGGLLYLITLIDMLKN